MVRVNIPLLLTRPCESSCAIAIQIWLLCSGRSQWLGTFVTVWIQSVLHQRNMFFHLSPPIDKIAFHGIVKLRLYVSCSCSRVRNPHLFSAHIVPQDLSFFQCRVEPTYGIFRVKVFQL